MNLSEDHIGMLRRTKDAAVARSSLSNYELATCKFLLDHKLIASCYSPGRSDLFPDMFEISQKGRAELDAFDREQEQLRKQSRLDRYAIVISVLALLASSVQAICQLLL